MRNSFFVMNSNRLLLSFLLSVVLLGSAPERARAVNIASQGTGIIGVNTAVNSSLGTPYAHAGLSSYVNDTLTLPVDTWNGDQATNGTAHASYAGIIWSSPRTDFVGSLTLQTASFFDGGWFGPNISEPGASGTLNSSYLIAPVVQITLDGGATWSTVPSTSNYVTAMTGVTLPVAFGPPVFASTSFTLTTPVTGINGIRLIGSEGGSASGGFMGLTELGVDASPVPEPSTLSLAGAGLLLASRRRSRAS
jgi:hypothetical protein